MKTDGWKASFLLGWPVFRCHVSFRECNGYLTLSSSSRSTFFFHEKLIEGAPENHDASVEHLEESMKNVWAVSWVDTGRYDAISY